jgi:hypothetical protein
VRMRWDFVPAAEVPRGREEQADWLYARWAEMDAWIERNRRDPAPEPRAPTAREPRAPTAP